MKGKDVLAALSQLNQEAECSLEIRDLGSGVDVDCNRNQGAFGLDFTMEVFRNPSGEAYKVFFSEVP